MTDTAAPSDLEWWGWATPDGYAIAKTSSQFITPPDPAVPPEPGCRRLWAEVPG